ncbi:MAG: GNAT family N-acetyltransferase [Heyndrickxia sp.]
MFTYVIDEEVSLRLFTENDTEEFYNLIIGSSNNFRKWISWIDDIKNKEDASEFIKYYINEIIENGGYPKSVAIIYRGEIAGKIGFNEIDKESKVGDIGYWLGEKFQGKGIMAKAFKTFIDYGFKNLGLNRIEVYISIDNIKSRKLPERFGFKEEGVLRQSYWLYDHYEDLVVYGLLAKEWI